MASAGRRRRRLLHPGLLATIGPASWQHGERFHYATPNTDPFGLVAERAGGARSPC
jgi:hypothetical protein